MTEKTIDITLFYSYACRDSYLAFRWLRHTQSSGALLRIIWEPFALRANQQASYWQRSWDEADSELRGFMGAQAALQQGEEAFQRFHDKLEEAVHEGQLELGDGQTLLDAARGAGLDLATFERAFQDRALADQVRARHEDGVRQFGVFGTPTLVFPNQTSLHLELTDIPEGKDAVGVLRAIALLGNDYPYVEQIKRTR